MSPMVSDQYTLQFKCPQEIRKYFAKHLFRGTVIVDTEEHHHIEYKTIWIYCIESLKPGKGNVQRAIVRLIKDRYDVRIVLPGPEMKHIAEKFGMVKHSGSIKDYNDPVEYWKRPERCLNGYRNPSDSDCAWCTRNRECKFKLFLEEFSYVI